MSERIRSRIERLEELVPTEVVLTLQSGKTFSHRGPPIRFFNDGMDQLRAERGPILSALEITVRGEGCGYMHQLLKALM
jgi:hypothetical protein